MLGGLRTKVNMKTITSYASLVSRSNFSLLRHRSLRPSSRTFSLATRGTPSIPPTIKYPKDEKNKSEEDGIVSTALHKLNFALENHPQETMMVFIASDIASIGMFYGTFSALGLQFSPEFALAFAISRPLRKLRLPLDLAATHAIAKAFPVTTKVNFAALSQAFPTITPQMGDQEPGKVMAFLNKTMDKASDIVNQYGAAYMIGSRYMGVLVIASLNYALVEGVDLMPYFEKFGVGEIGTSLGTWAAAVVLSSSIYPATLGITGYAVPLLRKYTKSIIQSK